MLLLDNTQRKNNGFTLIELLVVIAIISLLLSILMPSLTTAKNHARKIACESNLHQLVLANISYAVNNHGAFVLAAPDIFTGNNLKRWHGQRKTLNDFFDPQDSPLITYMADGKVKECTYKVNFKKGRPWDFDFEQGCGGYGYNMTYLGSRVWEDYTAAKCAESTRESEVRSPAATVMFADAAMAKMEQGQAYYLEYSFIEPFFYVVRGVPSNMWGNPSPSLHFRHISRVNAGWVDGHVDSRTKALHKAVNAYGVQSYDMNIGWFEPLNNSLFDLR